MKAQSGSSPLKPLHTPVVSVCLLSNEVAIARARVSYLKNTLEWHLFVEADHYHSGEPRPFAITPEDFGDDFGRVVVGRLVIPEEILRLEDRWAIEEYSRQWSVTLAKTLFPTAHLIVGDVDEIPSRDQVDNLNAALGRSAIVTLPMVMSYRYVNWLVRGGKPIWTSTKAIRAGTYTPGFRFRRGPWVPGNVGQHFRYLGHTLDDTAVKHQRYAHAEHDIGTRHGFVQSLVEAYQLTTIPEFSRKGSGLLTVKKLQELTEPAQFIAGVLPGLFNAHASHGSRTTRMTAAYLIERAFTRKLPEQVNVESRKVVFRALGKKLVSNLGWGVVMRIARRFAHASSLSAHRTLVDVARGVNRYGEWEGLDAAVDSEVRRLRKLTNHSAR